MIARHSAASTFPRSFTTHEFHWKVKKLLVRSEGGRTSLGPTLSGVSPDSIDGHDSSRGAQACCSITSDSGASRNIRSAHVGFHLRKESPYGDDPSGTRDAVTSLTICASRHGQAAYVPLPFYCFRPSFHSSSTPSLASQLPLMVK